jgi:WD40 repeat protein
MPIIDSYQRLVSVRNRDRGVPAAAAAAAGSSYASVTGGSAVSSLSTADNTYRSSAFESFMSRNAIPINLGGGRMSGAGGGGATGGVGVRSDGVSGVPHSPSPILTYDPYASMAARITAMTWINESYESLLLVGSDDGTVKIWKDCADSDRLEAHNAQAQQAQYQAAQNPQNGVGSNRGSFPIPIPTPGEVALGGGGGRTPTTVSSSMAGSREGSGSAEYVHSHRNNEGPTSIYSGFGNSSELTSAGVSLASAFVALPDIAQRARGSGLVLSWTQSAGSLVVGGNSSTIRVWDLGREQCVRVFDTGLDTCTTAIASRAVPMNLSSGSPFPFSYSSTSPPRSISPVSRSRKMSEGGPGAVSVSWNFAVSDVGGMVILSYWTAVVYIYTINHYL